MSTRTLRRLVLSPFFPLVLQALALLVVLALIGAGLGIGTSSSPSELMTLRKTNLATLVVWGLWWPAMIAVAIAFGRAWCAVCPMELVNRMGDELARAVGWRRVRMGKRLRAGWVALALYLLLQILVAGLSIHRVPHFTAVFLLALVGGAFLVGLVLRDGRSFCRAFCPASALLSTYSRVTAIQLEMRNLDVCHSCSSKECVRGENRHRFGGRSCPSLLRPFDRQPSDSCVLCLECARICPHDNVGFGLVAENAPIRSKALLRPFEAGFVMVALGFVSHEVIGEVKWLDAVFHFVPAAMAKQVPSVPFDWFEALWFLLLFPLAIWLIVAGLGRLLGHRHSLATLLLAAATGAAPVVAMAHLAKAAAKVGSWSSYLPLALRDPQGLGSLQRIADHSLTAPAALVGVSILGWAMLGLVAFIAWRAWRVAGRVSGELAIAARTGLASTAVLFGVVLTIWSWTWP